MRQAAPEPYKNLLYKDYPDKNGSKVNELALKIVTSDEAKEQIANKINELIKPKVDEKTDNMNPIVAAAFRKTIEKAVEQSVNAAIDTFIKSVDKNDPQGKAKA
jgi:predicted dinucleotide-utilizing enzyme